MIVFSLFMPFSINQYANAQIGVLPQPPTNLIAQAVSSSKINLSWTAPPDLLLSGYKIERSTDSGSTWNTIVQNTGSTSTTYSDSGLAPSTTYTYRVSTINPIGTSSPSNTASATTQTASTIPAAPTSLVANTVSSSQINLSWSAPTNNGGSTITGYNVYRGTSSSGETLLTSVSASTTSYTDGTVSNGQAYFYKVTAVN